MLLWVSLNYHDRCFVRPSLPVFKVKSRLSASGLGIVELEAVDNDYTSKSQLHYIPRHFHHP